jgi:hypothetical protein
MALYYNWLVRGLGVALSDGTCIDSSGVCVEWVLLSKTKPFGVNFATLKFF